MNTFHFHLGNFKNYEEIHQAAVHECRHFAQSLISRSVTGLPSQPHALPSRKILTPEWNDAGEGDYGEKVREIQQLYMMGQLTRSVAEKKLKELEEEYGHVHHLKDIEFETDLADAVDVFKDLLSRNNITEPEKIKHALQSFTGQRVDIPENLPDPVKPKYPKSLENKGFGFHTFFRALKKHAPAKYKAALKKMYQEISHLLTVRKVAARYLAARTTYGSSF